VEVEVRVECGAEAVQEGDGAELRAGPGRRTGAPERAADGAQQDTEHVAGEPGVVRQERADPLRHGEHPLTDGQRRQDVVGVVGPCGNAPRGANQPVRVGVGLCMATTVRRRAGRWNGGVVSCGCVVAGDQGGRDALRRDGGG